MRVQVFVRAVVAVAFYCSVALPAAAQGVGNLGGNVLDESGGVLPRRDCCAVNGRDRRQSGNGHRRSGGLSILEARPRDLHRHGCAPRL